MKVTNAMPMPSEQSQNKLLSELLTMRNRIAEDVELVNLSSGSIIYEAGFAEGYAYFPNDALSALLAVTDNGKSVEVAAVGNEGMVGIDALTGGGNPFRQAVVQCAGSAYRMPTRLLKKLFNQDSEIRLVILRYIRSLMIQISQAAVCNPHHSIEQQLCRKLLRTDDCLPGAGATLNVVPRPAANSTANVSAGRIIGSGNFPTCANPSGTMRIH